MKELAKLYRFDTKGKVRVWWVYSENDTYVVQHGLDGGKIQKKITKCKGKNLGKTNETTPEQQAEKEAKAKWFVQVQREDYAEDVNKAGLQIRPMLAHDYLKVPHRVDFEKTILQRKLDGLRLVAGYRWKASTEIELMTRKGENYDIPHFEDPVEQLLNIITFDMQITCQGLDGEAYIHGMKLQKIISLARKNKPESIDLKYYLFDLVIFDLPFSERYEVLKEAMIRYEEKYGEDHPFVVVKNTIVYNEATMKLVHDEFVGEGFEGAIIRHIDGMYKQGRSADLFKYKHFFDTETLIIDMFEDNNGNAMLVVKLKPSMGGTQQNLTPKRTHKERKKMLTEPENWIGNWINTRYQGRTEEGKLTFATGRELRECDDEGEPLI